MQWKILYAKHIQHNEWDTETVEKTQSEACSINWHQQTQAHTGLQRHTNKKQRAKSTADKPSPAGMGLLSNLSVPWL